MCLPASLSGSFIKEVSNVGQRTMGEEVPEVKASLIEEDVEGGLSAKAVQAFEEEFDSNPKNDLALNILTHSDQIESLIRRDVRVKINHTYNVKIKAEGKPVTHQHSTGRCWIFAALNCLRLSFMEKFKLSEFEFSQSYVYFWDHFERCNWFLENIIKTADEPVESRILQHLLHLPVEDGGQYDMVLNVINKYGLVPKSVFPESKHSSASRRLNDVLKRKLRDFAHQLRELHKKGSSISDLRSEKENQLSIIYRILLIHFGKPPKTFDWQFTNKDKKYQEFKNLTPQSFAQTHVYDPTNFVSLINDPRNPYNQLYTVDYLGNVVGGFPIRYINLPIEELKKYSRKQLEAGEPVWFGCDVGKYFHKDSAALDPDLFDYDMIFGTCPELDKATRLRYGDSMMTHAMVFSAVQVEDDKTVRWRVENSWGSSGKTTGYLLMSDKWFSEFNYQVAIDKKHLPEEVLDVLKQEPVVLPAWDPMGTLASQTSFEDVPNSFKCCL